MKTDYVDFVSSAEPSSPYAKHSFESFSPVFVDGVRFDQHYSQALPAQVGNRTPLQLQRDRILYSYPIRKLTEKYHVLFNGRRRIVRNYITHTMRVAQVTRAICRGLGLNQDFAEAIALGAKVGAAPFVHASKGQLARWALEKITAADEHNAADPIRQPVAKQLAMDFEEKPIPSWIASLKSQSTLHKIIEYIPWGAGSQAEPPHSTGVQSYWLLATNPFTHTALTAKYSPEVVFGVWRHSREMRVEREFVHRMRLTSAPDRPLAVSWGHATYEAIVVRYADDITWAIENLNDADQAALANTKTSVFAELARSIPARLPDTFKLAVHEADASRLYAYFIEDFVVAAQSTLRRLGRDGQHERAALREGQSGALIGLSPDGEEALRVILEFLNSQVFSEPRVRNRNKMLETVAYACAELLYDKGNDALLQMVNERGLLERWSTASLEHARALLSDDVHRIQAVLSVLACMGDQEIFEFVGIDAL